MKKRLIAVLSAVLVCTVISACQNNTDVNRNTEGADSTLFTEEQTDLPGDPSNTELPDVSGEPTAPVYSEGLSYDIYEGNVCRVSGIGTFTGKDLVIPSTYKGNKVVGIQASAFANCTAIETVVVSEGIATIDAGAFSGCSSLKSAVLPDSAVNVYNAIFKNCTSLESVVLPKTITDRIMSIGNMGDSSTSYRVYIWYGTINMLKDFWITGIGIGESAFRGVYPIYSFNTI